MALGPALPWHTIQTPCVDTPEASSARGRAVHHSGSYPMSPVSLCSITCAQFHFRICRNETPRQGGCNPLEADVNITTQRPRASLRVTQLMGNMAGTFAKPES